ncbi:MAG: type II secretion system F family protein [Candidatus Thermoplasmatota archaeon]|nr:type II secretion system F family protein [Candidatus Thermoplasmatota archaeon]
MKWDPWSFSYNLLNKRIEGVLPHFKDLHFQLRKSGIKIAFKAYISLMFLASIIAFIIAMIVTPILLPLIFGIELISLANILLSVMFAGLVFIFTLIIFYVYPGIMASNRKIPIENNLPYISSFLTLLSSSNVPPSVIFRSMARIDTLSEVKQDFSNMVRDVELFGKDLMNSILDNVKYIPNDKLREILKGYVATVRTGGNPTEYLRIATDNISRERMGKLDMMLESLSAIAEIYILVLVAMPLLFVVLLATLGMIGSGGMAMDPAWILYLLSYVGIPLMAAVIIVLVSTFEK